MVGTATEKSKAEEKKDETLGCVRACVCVCLSVWKCNILKGKARLWRECWNKKMAYRNVLSLNEVDGEQLDVILYWDDYSKMNFSSQVISTPGKIWIYRLKVKVHNYIIWYTKNSCYHLFPLKNLDVHNAPNKNKMISLWNE